MDIHDLTPEDEIIVLQRGMESDFWKLIQHKWGKFLDDSTSSLLSPGYKNRDFLAGKIRGMRDLLSYPERRVKNLLNPAEKKEL